MDEAMDLAAKHAAIAAWGGRFDGSAWLLLAAFVEPLDEVGLVCCAPEPLIVDSGQLPTLIEMQTVRSAHGLVCMLSVGLHDADGVMWIVETLVNPVADAAGPLLRALAGQQTVMVDCFGLDGTPVLRRILRLAPQLRAALADVVDLAAGEPTTEQRWDRAVEAVHAHFVADARPGQRLR